MRPTLLLVPTLLVAPACSPPRDRAASPGPLRLVDLASRAEIAAPTPLPEAEIRGREQVTTAAEVAAPAGGGRLGCAFVAHEKEAPLRVLGPQGSAAIEFAARELPEAAAKRLERARAGEGRATEELLRAYWDRRVPLPSVFGGGEGRVLLVTTPRPGTRLVLERLSARAAYLAENRPLGPSPYARRVTLGASVREALVLPAAARFEVEVRLPPGSPTLDLEVARVGGGRRRDTTVEFAAQAGEGNATRVDGRLELPATAKEARPWSVDLSSLAGRRVRLGFRIGADAGDALVLLISPVIASPSDSAAPDVVWISLDTVRADRCSFLGGPRATTPSLDALAREAVVFERAIAPAPWTLPSHTSQLSGEQVDRHGTVRSEGRIPPELPWLPEEFRRAGYRTVAFTGAGYLHPRFGYARGFETYRFTDPVHPVRGWAEARPHFRGVDRVAAAVAAAAERRRILDLLAAPRRRPLFLFLHTYQAHEYHADPDVLRRFGAKEEELELLLDGVYGERVEESPFMRKGPQDPPLPELRRLATIVYDAGLVDADRFVGDVVEALKESGRWTRTILVVSSDHGENLYDHRDGIGHGNALFEEQIHVPLLIRVPGTPARRVSDVVSLVDLAPTLRRLAGLLPADAPPLPVEDGRDLAPLLRGEALPARPALVRGGEKTLRQPPFRALRGPRFKLTERRVRGRGEGDEQVVVALRDLQEDPRERRDVSAVHPELRDRLLERLHRWVEALSRHAHATREQRLPARVRENLEALGYLGGK